MANQKKWEEDIAKVLVGRKIIAVRYMNEKEIDDHGWTTKALIMVLDNGTAIYPSRDDEGNDAGALFTTLEEMPTIPVQY